MTPFRVEIDANNQPTAAQTYTHGATPVAGMVAPVDGLTDGEVYLLLAEEHSSGVPSGAWEMTESAWNAAGSAFDRATLIDSSSGSKLDWSAGGLNAVPRLKVLGRRGAQNAPRRVLSVSLSGDASVEIACRPNCNYLVAFNGLDLSTDQVALGVVVSTDGVSFNGGASDYDYNVTLLSSTASGAFGQSSAMLMSTIWLGNAGDGEEISGHLWVLGAANSGEWTRIVGQMATQSYVANPGNWLFAGARRNAQADIVVALAPTAGTFLSGQVAVWEYPMTGGE